MHITLYGLAKINTHTLLYQIFLHLDSFDVYFFLHYNIFYKFTFFDKHYRKLYKPEMNENKMGSFYPHAITINGWKKEYNLTGDH